DNIFIVKRGTLVTPPTYNSLKGITRGAVLDIAHEQRLTVREEPCTMFDVYAADEVFITGTAAEIAPCVEVDHRVVGAGKPGPVTKQLIAGFRELTTSTGTAIFEK